MRQINLIVSSCSECPYCQYDGNYGISYDSGYDCIHRNGNGRLVDDHNWDKLDYETKQKGIPIPDNCPLEKIGRKHKLEKLIKKIKQNG